jgi:hypothetical protein
MKSLTDIRFEIIVAMLNEDPKLYNKLKFYLSEKPTLHKQKT